MPVTPSQLQELLSAAIPAREPVLVTGAPGVGKSDIVSQAATAAGADLILSHPAVSDPTDFKGLPWPDKDANSANFLPFGDFHRALNASVPTVWFLDDLGQSSPAVQAAAMQLLLARRVNGHILPDTVTFVAATNRRTDRAGVSGILEPVKSRFVTIVELEPTIDDWCNWAIDHGVTSTLIAFIRFRPDLLSKFEATADLTNSPVPRTWAHLARIEALKLSQSVEAQAMAGAVGEGPALEYLGFRSMVAQLVNLDAILLDPDKAPIPSEPSQLYATAVGLAGKANSTNFARIATYVTRMVTESDRGEFAVLCSRDAVRRDPKIIHSNAYVHLCSGPVGKLITGQAN